MRLCFKTSDLEDKSIIQVFLGESQERVKGFASLYYRSFRFYCFPEASSVAEQPLNPLTVQDHNKFFYFVVNIDLLISIIPKKFFCFVIKKALKRRGVVPFFVSEREVFFELLKIVEGLG